MPTFSGETEALGYEAMVLPCLIENKILRMVRQFLMDAGRQRN